MSTKIKHNILIVGGDSTIGSSFFKKYSNKSKYIKISLTTKKKKSSNLFLDLRNPKNNKINFNNFDIFIICASITSINECQKHYTKTKKINIDGVKYIIDRADKFSKKLIYLSSHSVFDGSKPFLSSLKARNPKNNYGKQKKIIENYILKKNLKKNFSILRISKVDLTLKTILNNWHFNLKNNQVIQPYKGVNISPVSIQRVLQAIYLIITKNLNGVFNLSASDQISYSNLANLLANYHNFDKKLILEQYPSKKILASFPKYSTLKNSKIFSDKFSNLKSMDVLKKLISNNK